MPRSPRSSLRPVLHELNRRLKRLECARASEDELMGARLYTGPMYVKYNATLRGVRSSKAAEFARWYASCRGNRYATSLHVINSALHKMSKVCGAVFTPPFHGNNRLHTLDPPPHAHAHRRCPRPPPDRRLDAFGGGAQLTFAQKVYRGIAGGLVPPEFWRPNEFGIKGGVEFSFLSTTTDREVALRYASGRGAGVVLEIQQGMGGRGANLADVSQYPFEAEVTFGPLTGLEVQSTRVVGGVLVVEVSLAVNLAERPIEQVVGQVNGHEPQRRPLYLARPCRPAPHPPHPTLALTPPVLAPPPACGDSDAACSRRWQRGCSWRRAPPPSSGAPSPTSSLSGCGPC